MYDHLIADFGMRIAEGQKLLVGAALSGECMKRKRASAEISDSLLVLLIDG